MFINANTKSAGRATKSRYAALAVLSLGTIVAVPGVAQAGRPAPVLASYAREENRLPLLQAVSEGSAEKMEVALAAGADVNASDKDGKTPLMLAASIGRTDLVQTLLDKGADVNRLDKDGKTALHYVLAGGASSAAEAPKKKRGGFGNFLNKAKDLGGKALKLASHAGPLLQFLPGGPLVQNLAQGLMMTQGGNLLGPGASFALGSGTAWSGVLGSALMNASGRNNSGALLASVDGLLGSGSGGTLDPSALASGWKTLLGSAGEKQPELFKAMGNLGPDSTPVERAAWAGFLQLAQSGNEAEMQALIADPSFAPILAKATGGLRTAVDQLPGRDGGVGIVKALLARGANPTIADKSGVTPAERAKVSNLTAIVPLLEATAVAAE